MINSHESCKKLPEDNWGIVGPNSINECDQVRVEFNNKLYRGHTFSGVGRKYGKVEPINQAGFNPIKQK